MFKLIGYIFLIGLLAAVFLPNLATQNNSNLNSTQASKKEVVELNNKLKNEIKAKKEAILKEVRKEKKVIAAAWADYRTAFPVLTVAVINNQGNRDGFAQYICLIVDKHKLNLKKYGFPFVKVEITDAKKAINNQDFTPIGEAKCKVH